MVFDKIGCAHFFKEINQIIPLNPVGAEYPPANSGLSHREISANACQTLFRNGLESVPLGQMHT